MILMPDNCCTPELKESVPVSKNVIMLQVAKQTQRCHKYIQGDFPCPCHIMQHVYERFSFPPLSMSLCLSSSLLPHWAWAARTLSASCCAAFSKSLKNIICYDAAAGQQMMEKETEERKETGRRKHEKGRGGKIFTIASKSACR